MFTKGVCARCSTRVCYNDDERVCVVDAYGSRSPYAESIPKQHNTVVIAVKRYFKPNVFVSPAHDICISCRRPPGSEGCTVVGQEITVKGETMKVDHSSEL